MRRRLLRLRKRVRSIAIGAGLALAAIAALLLLSVSTLVRSSPSWWRHYALDSDLRERATAVENAAVSQLYRARETDTQWNDQTEPWRSVPWSISLKEEDASAWLSARLRNWMASDIGPDGTGLAWPDGLGQPQVHFESGRLRIGATLRFEQGTRVVSAAIEPEFRDDGSLWLQTTWVHLGRLPLPASPMLARADRAITKELPDEVAEEIATGAERAGFFEILRGNAPLAQRPTLRLDGGRAVRLIGLRLRDGRIELDCQTIARRTASRE